MHECFSWWRGIMFWVEIVDGFCDVSKLFPTIYPNLLVFSSRFWELQWPPLQEDPSEALWFPSENSKMQRTARSIPKWTLIAPIGFLIYRFVPQYSLPHFIQCCVIEITPTLVYNLEIEQQCLVSFGDIKQHSDWFRINPNSTNLDLVGTRFVVFTSN